MGKALLQLTNSILVWPMKWLDSLVIFLGSTRSYCLPTAYSLVADAVLADVVRVLRIIATWLIFLGLVEKLFFLLDYFLQSMKDLAANIQNSFKTFASLIPKFPRILQSPLNAGELINKAREICQK